MKVHELRAADPAYDAAFRERAREIMRRTRADPEIEQRRIVALKRAARRPDVAAARNARSRKIDHATVMRSIQAKRTFEQRSAAALKGHATRRAERAQRWKLSTGGSNGNESNP